MFSSKKRLDNAYKNAEVVGFDDDSKFIFFSDCHRGDNSFADDFANNRNIYFHALKYYYQNGFHYCEIGDGDELWENLTFESIFEAHKPVYILMKLFYKSGRFHKIWGNHDMVLMRKDYVKKHLFTYFETKTGEDTELFDGITVHEGLILKHDITGQEIFLTHGHQADLWNYIFWKWSRFLVRVLWKPLNLMGIADPTSPAKNWKELIKIERRTKKWIIENSNLMTIVGHTHRPRFPDPNDIAYFNAGSCVHPRSITGIEIEGGEISLVKWQIATKDDGTLQIVRILLEGPRKVMEYKSN